MGSGLTSTNRKKFLIFSGRVFPGLALAAFAFAAGWVANGRPARPPVAPPPPVFDGVVIDHPNPDSGAPVWDSRREVRFVVTRVTRDGNSVWLEEGDPEPGASWLVKLSGPGGRVVYALRRVGP